MSDDRIEHRVIDNNFFYEVEKDLVTFIFPYRFNLQNGYQIDFKYGNVLSGYKTNFTIHNTQSIIYNFIEMNANVIVDGMFAINKKGNRIAYKTLEKNENYTKTFAIHELAIIYDAVCNDNNVRIRTEPNLSSSTIGKLNKNNSVKIIDCSMEKFVIDEDVFYWHEIETQDGKTGWVYGKYLDIEK